MAGSRGGESGGICFEQMRSIGERGTSVEFEDAGARAALAIPGVSRGDVMVEMRRELLVLLGLARTHFGAHS